MSNARRKTTDEKFNDSYAEQGIQPTYKVKNVKKTPRAVNNNAQAANDNYQAANDNQPQYNQAPARPKRISLPKKKKQTNDVLTQIARAKVSALNIGLWSAGGTAWIAQAFFAVMSMVLFVIAEALAVIFDTEINPEDNIAVKGWKIFVDGAAMFVSSINDAVKFVTGIDFGSYFEALDPFNFFIITYLIAMVIGLATLAFVYMTYTLNFLRPLSGEGEGTKQGVFLLALIGYCFPFLNIIPWFIFWTIAVWRYPK